MGDNPGDFTVLLHRWREGDRTVEDELFRMVLPELKRWAHYFLSWERRSNSMQSGDLLDSVCRRLLGMKEVDWQDRRHFVRLAARTMRRYAIDHYRRNAGREFLPLEDVQAVIRFDPGERETTVTIDTLLDLLEKESPELCQVVELKFFLGLTNEEAADAMGLKLHTLERRWHDARLWLFERLKDCDVGQR